MNNPITGVFILIAIFMSSAHSAVLMLLGVTASTLTAVAMGLHSSSIDNGIYGYNGALVGIALGVFHFGDDNYRAEFRTLPIAVVLVAALSTFITAGVGTLFVGKLGLSPFTFPFVLATWCWLLASSGSPSSSSSGFAYFPLDFEILQPVLLVNENTTTFAKEVGYNPADVVEGVFKGVAQIFFQPHTGCGVLILIGMLLCSPTSSALCLLGSATSTATAVALGANAAAVYEGIWGYNGALTAIALGGMFFAPVNFSVWGNTMAGCVATTIFTAAVRAALCPFGLPALTFPFNFTSWIFCLAGKNMSGLFTVELGALSFPEDHRRRLLFFMRVNVDAEGRVSLEDAVANGMALETFRMIDESGDGYLSEAEYNAWLSRGYRGSTATLQRNRFFEEAGVGTDGVAVTLFGASRVKGMSPEAFAEIDTNGSGTINRAQYASWQARTILAATKAAKKVVVKSAALNTRAIEVQRAQSCSELPDG
jgi:urea transporter